MSIDKDKTKEIIKQFGENESDTGSSSVQIALLTHQISHLTKHLKTHKKDKHSQRGLLNKVAHRKKLLKYLKMNNETQYAELITALGIRG